VNDEPRRSEAGVEASGLEQQHRGELERIAAGAAAAGALLTDLGSDGVDQALAAVAAARYELDLTERQLVRLARQAGRSWAQIGAQLGITTGHATHERFDPNS
jgi:hypothetical protein